jgi:L-lactate dehydrogenase complex protein LldF
MKQQLPIYFFEPTADSKRKDLMEARLRTKEDFDINEIRLKLKQIREASIKGLGRYVREAKTNLSKFKDVKVTLAATTEEAGKTIKKAAGRDPGPVLTNYSTTVKEVIPDLDLEVIQSYDHEVDMSDLGLTDTLKNFYDIPTVPKEEVWNSLKRARETSFNGTKLPVEAHVGLLGANCISKNGEIYFVQHLQNISKIFRTVDTLILIIGIDKVVKGDVEAEFQAKCCGLFGLDTILADLLFMSSEAGSKRKRGRKRNPEKVDYPPHRPKRIHVILLDNHRKELMRSDFNDLSNCIGCRACASMCPNAKINNERTYRTPREILFSVFTEGLEHAARNGLFDCTTCKNCERICPVGIPLAEYTLEMKAKAIKEGYHPEALDKMVQNMDETGNPYGVVE